MLTMAAKTRTASRRLLSLSGGHCGRGGRHYRGCIHRSSPFGVVSSSPSFSAAALSSSSRRGQRRQRLERWDQRKGAVGANNAAGCSSAPVVATAAPMAATDRRWSSSTSITCTRTRTRTQTSAETLGRRSLTIMTDARTADGRARARDHHRHLPPSSSRFSTGTSTSAAVPPPPLPPRFLRDANPANYDPRTHQRDAATLHFDVDSGKPLPPPPAAGGGGGGGGGVGGGGGGGGEGVDDDPRYRIEGCKVVSTRRKSKSEVGEKEEELLVVRWGDGVESSYPMESVEDWVDVWRGGGPEPEEAELGWGQRCKEALAPEDDRFRLDRRGRALWRNLTELDVRGATPASSTGGNSPVLSLPFRDVVHDVPDGSNRAALEALYGYGIVLVTDTPVVTSDKEEAAAAIAAFASSVGGGTDKSNPETSLLARYLSARQQPHEAANNEQRHPVVLPDGTDGPQRTLYGNVWYTTTAGQAGGTSVADSAYGSDGLPLHTDLCYHRDPAGLQVFAMIAPAASGGESVFADGFAVAEELRTTDEEAFRTLCLATRRYRSIDDATGWHLQAAGSVIETAEADGDGEVLMIRHNDLDRLPDLPPRWMRHDDERQLGAVEEYYDRLERAHAAWDELLGRDEFRLVMRLGPGDMVVVANHRVMHGRCSFVTGVNEPRSVIGCYVSQDELESRFRMEGFLID